MEEIRLNFTKLLKIADIISFVISILTNVTIVIALRVIEINRTYAIVLFVVAMILLCIAILLEEAVRTLKVSKKDFYKALKRETTREDSIYDLSNCIVYSSVR